MDNSKYRWTERDNVIADAELKLSRLLTTELNARPAVGLQMLFVSQQVQAKVRPIIDALEAQVGYRIKADVDEHREGGQRKIYVQISHY